MNAIYRDNGAIGALLDEYERALGHLIDTIIPVGDAALATLVDRVTKDEDCRSIQTILTHVVQAGYTYAIEMRKGQGEKLDYRDKIFFPDARSYIEALQTMFAYTESVFDDYPNIKLESFVEEEKMIVRWGQRYDVEQLMEHAIVHILRHRRQIERFLLRM